MRIALLGARTERRVPGMNAGITRIRPGQRQSQGQWGEAPSFVSSSRAASAIACHGAKDTLAQSFAPEAVPASRKPQNFNALFTNRKEVRLASWPGAAILTIAR